MRNLSDKSIYFKNSFYYEMGIPEVLNLSLHRLPYDLEQIEKMYHSYKNDDNTYFVMVENLNMSNKCFFLILDELEYENFISSNEYTIASMEQELFLFYNLFRLQKFYDGKNLNKQSVLFKYDKKEFVSPKDIKKDLSDMRNEYSKLPTEKDSVNISNMLIFLKPHESKEISFNLLGFKVIGGDYVFTLNFSQLENFIFVKSNITGTQQKKILPNLLNGFVLYKNGYDSNQVKIKF